mmetsp:Transcript_24535/g.80078  ORF Transcript_24535/g.80078 Transcript_24535/m.80078 type:complete len:198 (-) Transcript_24535:44-637(-)
MEWCRAALVYAALPIAYWALCAAAMSHVMNRLPSKSTSKVPCVEMCGVEPHVLQTRVFGCPAYVNMPSSRQPGGKHPVTAESGVFVGYNVDSVESDHSYLVYVPSAIPHGRAVLRKSVDVTFHEFWRDPDAAVRVGPHRRRTSSHRRRARRAHAARGAARSRRRRDVDARSVGAALRSRTGNSVGDLIYRRNLCRSN